MISSQNSKFKPELAGFNFFNFHYNESNNATKTLFQQGIEAGCQGFVLSDDVFPLFLSDFYAVHDDCIQVFKEKRLIVYQNDVDEKLLKSNDSWRSEPALDDLPANLFIEYDKVSENFSFLTTKFAGSKNESSKLIILTEAHLNDDPERTLNAIDLFPNKILNLQGREVVLSLFNYMPYVLWKEVDESDEEFNSREKLLRTPLHIDGTESWVFLEFCKKFNCSLLISLDEAGEWGEIFDNKTGNGILGAVAEKRAEVGVGALYSWYHESLFLSLSKPISRTGITCITPKPSLLDPVGTVILPFSPYLWLAVFSSYFISILFYKALRFSQSFIDGSLGSKESSEETISEIFLYMLGVFVLHSVKMNIRQVSVMFFLVCVLIVGLMIGNSYSSALASVLTIPRFEKAIDTVEELAASGTEWGSTHDAWIFSIQLATQPMILALLDKFETASKDVLEQRAIKQDMSFSIERLPYGHYAIGEYITEQTVNNYHIMLNDIYYELCVAMSTKTWPLMGYLDDLILQIAQSGVQQYVELEVVKQNSNNKIQAAVANSRHRENIGPIKLTPSHVSGPFILLGAGLLISAGVLVGEIIYNQYKIKQSRKIIKLWN